jgi:ParB-like chromosome segregation protein Spo0J
MAELEIRYEDLDDIISADSNPKDHDLGVLYQSMKRFGFTNPIIMNESTGKLLAGHGRLQTLQMMKDNGDDAPKRIDVAKDIGDERIETWYVPVLYGVSIDNVNEAQAYLIADNRLTELGGWKPMDLMDSLTEILEETGNLDGTGYDLDDVEDILSDMETTTFDVSDTIAELDDEKEVSIAVGRYKFKVDAQDFYDWEEMAQSTTNSKDTVDIAEFIKKSLGLIS